MYQVDDFNEIPLPYAVFEIILSDDGSRVLNSRYAFVNARYCQMAGMRRADILGKTYKEVYPDADNHWFSYCYQAGVRRETVHGRTFEPVIQHWLEFTVAPVSKPGYVAFTFREIDREQELLKSEKRDHQTGQLILRMSRILSSEMSYEDSMNRVLKELSKVMHPDRIYILETDRITFTNTFEWCAPGVSSEIDTLQGLGYEEFLKDWESFTNNGTTVIMPDIRVLWERNPKCYEILRRQGIERLIAAPFFQSSQLIGYLCVDNYEENDAINTQRLLEMVSFFIGAKVLNQRLLMKLDHLSHYDMLTGAKNRNARIEFCERGKASGESIGVIYADVDGLKQINDRRGHGAGDDVICHVARIMTEVLGQTHVYREGGDEFVALLPGIEREEFMALTRRLRGRFAEQRDYVIATGCAWDADGVNIQAVIQLADQRMYECKRRYYAHHDRRRS